MSSSHDQKRILLTGATGYVGGRLLPLLQAQGRPVRVMVRRPEQFSDRGPDVQVVHGDVLRGSSLDAALEGVDTAYYLIHSMGEKRDYARRDSHGAQNFAAAARRAGLRRIVYLGGLGRGDDLSQHLRSRQQVGRILRNSGVETIELRASIVIGSGSLSFELVRSLVERLPVMITPRWVETPAQPIAVEDLLAYLVESLDLPAGASRVYEVGGTERTSYLGLMKEYARQRGLKRLFIPVPVLSPRLSSLWLGLVTPLFARIGSKLIESVRNATLVEDGSAKRDFQVRPRGVSEAITRALANEDQDFAQTRWSDALSAGGSPKTYGGIRLGSRLVDSREVEIATPPAKAFVPIRRIGGQAGWYFGNWLWHLRGFLDLLVGGVGLRRGRRHPDRLSPGDSLDFWRVEAFEPDRLLRLAAEMRVPGRAWLQFEVQPSRSGSRIRQTALFDPKGTWGRAYWYLLYPLHLLVFSGMLRGIVRRAGGERGRAQGSRE